ncbi:MAG: DUF937 domain-containing protein [Verrucomicrobiota bacterium]
MDLLTLAKSRFNLDTLTDLSDLLGLPADDVSQLLEEALPTILTIFKTAAANPSKSPALDQIIAKTDPSLLDDPDESLTHRGPEIMRAGKGTLARLLGPELTDYIAPIAKSTNLGEGKIASALGALTPFISALLARHSSSAEELHTLLANQDLSAKTPDQKAPAIEPQPEKSYLPDPDKKPERRPRKKRPVAILVTLVALLGGGTYALYETQPDWLQNIPILRDILNNPAE